MKHTAKRRRALMGLAMGLTLALALSACSVVPKSGAIPPRSALIGQWIHDGDDGRSVLRITPGGVYFTDVPEQLINSGASISSPRKGKWNKYISVNGSWSSVVSEGDAYPVIRCSLPQLELQLFYDSYTYKKPVLTLFYGIGFDFRYDYHRKRAKRSE